MNNIIYLDNAATSFPKPECVIRACRDCLNNFCVNPGRGAHFKSLYAGNIIYSAREELCKLFNIDNPERIAFTLNTTQSINFALKGVLSKGDHVIITSMEHNSVLRPICALSEKKIKYHIAPADKNGNISVCDIARLIKPETKLICMMHASNVTGKIYNIEEIGRLCAEKNIIFMVDAAQSAGKINIDVKKMHIDILCFPGHKGLFSPPGCGGLYVSEGVRIRPLIEGGTGSFSESRHQPLTMPDMLESGTQNILSISGLLSGIKFLRQNFKEIREKELRLTELLYENIKNTDKVTVFSPPPYENCGIVSIVPTTKTPSEVSYLLDRDYNIACRSGFHCAPLACSTIGASNSGTLRISPGFFTKESDIDYFSKALKKILS